MSPHDFLDGPEPADPRPPTRRQQRRAAKNAKRAARRETKADARERYRAKLRDARDAPRSPLALLIVGVVFFGGIIVAGTIAGMSGHTEPAKHATSSAAAGPVTQPTAATPATSAATPAADPKTTATMWLIAYFPGQDWQQYVAPGAVDALDGTRAGFFNGTYLGGSSVNIQEYTWRDVAATKAGWTGTVDVLLDPGRVPPLVASLQVTMTPAPAPQVSSVKVLYYGEGQD
ncbi:hypothetical protein GCM10027414_36830 [Humibacter ginsengiterrae]